LRDWDLGSLSFGLPGRLDGLFWIPSKFWILSTEGLLLKQQAKSQNPGIHFQTNQNLSISGMNVVHLFIN
jgi:hypothetical protein